MSDINIPEMPVDPQDPADPAAPADPADPDSDEASSYAISPDPRSDDEVSGAR